MKLGGPAEAFYLCGGGFLSTMIMNPPSAHCSGPDSSVKKQILLFLLRLRCTLDATPAKTPLSAAMVGGFAPCACEPDHALRHHLSQPKSHHHSNRRGSPLPPRRSYDPLKRCGSTYPRSLYFPHVHCRTRAFFLFWLAWSPADMLAKPLTLPPSWSRLLILSSRNAPTVSLT